MRPLLKPGLRRLWRDDSTLQIGTDPDRAVVLGGLDPRVAGLVDALDGTRDEEAIVAAARTKGLDPEQVRRLMGLLGACGALDDAATDPAPLAGLSRSRAGPTGSRPGCAVRAQPRRRPRARGARTAPGGGGRGPRRRPGGRDAGGPAGRRWGGRGPRARSCPDPPGRRLDRRPAGPRTWAGLARTRPPTPYDGCPRGHGRAGARCAALVVLAPVGALTARQRGGPAAPGAPGRLDPGGPGSGRPTGAARRQLLPALPRSAPARP